MCEVFYGTNRRRDSAPEARASYGQERSRDLEYGICSVTIPPGHISGRTERPRWWKLEFVADPQKHVAIADVAPFSTEDHYLNALGRAVERSAGREVFVFVHGYANDFDDAALRTAQLAYDLGLCEKDSYVVPMMFTWPSRGLAQGYAADSESAEYSAPFLKEFLLTLRRKAGVTRINLLAHSMGNQVVGQAVRELDQELGADEGVALQELILAAPDIDRDIFETQVMPRMARVARRVTLYLSERDKALKLSMELQHFPRLGGVEVLEGGKRRLFVAKGLDSIDASATDPSFFGHRYYAEVKAIVEDIARLLRDDDEPPKRGLVASGLGWWLFK